MQLKKELQKLIKNLNMEKKENNYNEKIASSDSKADAVVAVCAVLVITAIIVFWVSTQ